MYMLNISRSNVFGKFVLIVRDNSGLNQNVLISMLSQKLPIQKEDCLFMSKNFILKDLDG